MESKKIKLKFLQVLLYSSITGIVVGLFLYIFKTLAHFLYEKQIIIYNFVRNNPIYIPLFMLGLAVLAFLIYLCIKYEPNAKGGGIARASGILKGLITFRWLRLLISTLFSSLLGTISGLPMGLEGPSVIMGTSLSNGVYNILKPEKGTKRYILTSGTAAGFTVATGSILAGIVFALEEIHKRFSFLLVMIVVSATASAGVIVQLLDNIFDKNSQFLPIGEMSKLPLKYIYLVIIIGILSGILAKIFNKSIDIANKYISKLKLNAFIKILINLILVGVIGLFIVQVTGSGHELIIEIFENNFSLIILIILLILKIILISITINSGATGGMFIPVLVVGSIFGGILQLIFSKLGLNNIYYKNIIFLTAASFFASSMATPLTTIVFFLETTLDFNNIMFLVLSIFISMVISHLLNNEGINEGVLNNILKNYNHEKKLSIYEIRGKVYKDAFVISKQARDILWPANCIIKAIKRENKGYQMVKGGDKFLHENDVLIFQIQTYDIKNAKEELSNLIYDYNLEVKKIYGE